MNEEINDFIIASSGLELASFLTGFGMMERIMSVLGSRIISIFTLVVVFKLVANVLKSQNNFERHEEITSLKSIGTLLGSVVLMVRFFSWETKVGFITLKVEKNTDPDKRYSTFMRQEGEIVLIPNKFKIGQTTEERFGDTWFNIDIDYKSIYQSSTTRDLFNQVKEDEVFYVKRPRMAMFPIILIEGFIYGKDGTFTRDSYGNIEGGLIHKMFGESYNQLKRYPGHFFEMFKENSPRQLKNNKIMLRDRERKLRSEKQRYYRFLNNEVRDLISMTSTYPLNIHNQFYWKQEELGVSYPNDNLKRTINAYMNHIQNNVSYVLGIPRNELYQYSSTVNDIYINPKYTLMFRGNEDSRIYGFRNGNKYFRQDIIGDNYIHNQWSDEVDTTATKVSIFGKTTLFNFYSDDTNDTYEYKNEIPQFTSYREYIKNGGINDYLYPRKFIDTEVNEVQNFYNVSSDSWNKKQISFNLLDILDKTCPSNVNINNCVMSEFYGVETGQLFNYTNTKRYLKLPIYSKGGIETSPETIVDLSSENNILSKEFISSININTYYDFYFPPITQLNSEVMKNIPTDRMNSMTKVPKLINDISYRLKEVRENFDFGKYFGFSGGLNGLVENGDGGKYSTSALFSLLGSDFFNGYNKEFENRMNRKVTKILEENQNYYTRIRDMEMVIRNSKKDLYFNDRRRIRGIEDSKKGFLDKTTEYLSTDKISMDNRSEKSKDKNMFEEMMDKTIEIVLWLFNKLLGLVFMGIYNLLLDILPLIFSITYSVIWGLGILMTIVLIGLVPVKVAFDGKWLDRFVLITKKYRRHRLRDFVVLLVVVIVNVMAQPLLKFTGQQPERIQYILQIIIAFGVFYLLRFCVRILRSVIDVERVGRGIYDKISGGMGKTIQTGFNVSGHLTTRAMVGTKKVGGGVRGRVTNRLPEGSARRDFLSSNMDTKVGMMGRGAGMRGRYRMEGMKKGFSSVAQGFGINNPFSRSSNDGMSSYRGEEVEKVNNPFNPNTQSSETTQTTPSESKVSETPQQTTPTTETTPSTQTGSEEVKGGDTITNHNTTNISNETNINTSGDIRSQAEELNNIRNQGKVGTPPTPTENPNFTDKE